MPAFTIAPTCMYWTVFESESGSKTCTKWWRARPPVLSRLLYLCGCVRATEVFVINSIWVQVRSKTELNAWGTFEGRVSSHLQCSSILIKMSQQTFLDITPTLTVTPTCVVLYELQLCAYSTVFEFESRLKTCTESSWWTFGGRLRDSFRHFGLNCHQTDPVGMSLSHPSTNYHAFCMSSLSYKRVFSSAAFEFESTSKTCAHSSLGMFEGRWGTLFAAQLWSTEPVIVFWCHAHTNYHACLFCLIIATNMCVINSIWVWIDTNEHAENPREGLFSDAVLALLPCSLMLLKLSQRDLVDVTPTLVGITLTCVDA